MRNDDLPSRESMKDRHKVRRFRRSNEEHGARAYLGRKHKPWRKPGDYVKRSAVA